MLRAGVCRYFVSFFVHVDLTCLTSKHGRQDGVHQYASARQQRRLLRRQFFGDGGPRRLAKAGRVPARLRLVPVAAAVDGRPGALTLTGLNV